MVQQNIMQ